MILRARSHWVTATATASSYFCRHEWVVWNPMGECSHWRGVSMAMATMSSWNGLDTHFAVAMAMATYILYVLGCCHCHCCWCPPIWTLTTENKVAVAVDAPQCEWALRYQAKENYKSQPNQEIILISFKKVHDAYFFLFCTGFFKIRWISLIQLEPVKHNWRLLKTFSVSPTESWLFSVMVMMPYRRSYRSN